MIDRVNERVYKALWDGDVSDKTLEYLLVNRSAAARRSYLFLNCIREVVQVDQ